MLVPGEIPVAHFLTEMETRRKGKKKRAETGSDHIAEGTSSQGLAEILAVTPFRSHPMNSSEFFQRNAPLILFHSVLDFLRDGNSTELVSGH